MYVFRVLTKDDMNLYRHSTACPSAIQMFLDENPRYWGFVPMLNEEANDVRQTVTGSTADIKTKDARDDETIKRFINNLPIPPPNYRFSQRQYHQQYVFFQSQRDQIGPNPHHDLYNAKTIAVRKYFFYGLF